MAVEINGDARHALTPSAFANVPAAPWLVREAGQSSPRPPRLLDRVREANRLRHGSRSTEKSYVGWIRRFILFHDKRHPAEMGASEVAQFLSSLAVEGRVAASTQNQALSALLFLYRHVLHQELPWLRDVVRARRPKHLPIVLTRDEVRAVISKLDGTPRLMAGLLYGSGLRLLECARLRVQDIDFAVHQIIVRDGKGAKDRVTVLPNVAREPPPSPSARIRPAARRARCRPAGGARQTRHSAYVPTLLRDSPARRRTRHPHGPRAAGPQRRQHHDDLYARSQSWACCRDEPCRPCPGSVNR
jgi:integrase